MDRSVAARIADVGRVVEAARRVSLHRSSVVPLIAESTGLSAAGVELALTKHLELDPTEAELAALIAAAGDAPRVAVILSSNVFVGALRAIALARAASEQVIVRPSRRDPAFARALVEALGESAVRLDEGFDVASVDVGEVHVYGRDETIADVRKRVRPGVVVRGHGAGMGIAWVSAGASLDEAARGLADDVVVFDQRGCLSPRTALVEGDIDRASAFAERLHAELERLELLVPRGALPAEERATSDRYVATMTYACRALVGTAHAIGIAPPGARLVPSPAYRHVHVAACAAATDAAALLAPLAHAVVAVGTDDLGSAGFAPPWARLSALGRMQRPPLDGPVDRRET